MATKRKTEEQRAVCETCAYFIRSRSEQPMQPEYGDCRRFPPCVVSDADDGLMTVWPMVELLDGCGEWRARMNS